MVNKRIWTTQEDNFLREQANSAQHRNWVKISEKLNEKFGGEFRSPKQCRQRFINHAVTPSQSPFSNSWCGQNTRTLFQLYEIHGPRWTIIAHTMKNKSENIVKNKFYCSLRKFARKLNKFLKSGKNKYKKQIRYESIIRIMDAHDTYSQLPENFKNWSSEIRKKILQLTQVTISDGQISDQILDWLSENINKFNLQTRSYKPKKPQMEEPQKINPQPSLKSEFWKNISQTDEQIFLNNNNRNKKEIDCGNMDELLKQNNSKIQSERICEQNQKFNEMLMNENLSQEELRKDFGTSVNFQSGKGNNCGEDLYEEMFSEEFPRFQIDEFLL